MPLSLYQVTLGPQRQGFYPTRQREGQVKEATVNKAHVCPGVAGEPGAGGRCCLEAEAFLDDRAWLTPPPPTPPQPDSRKHDRLWLMMKQRHGEGGQKGDRPSSSTTCF